MIPVRWMDDESSPHRGRLQRLGSLLLLLLALSGCESTGTVYFAEPSIFTRERIVQERVDEVSRLKRLRERFDNFESSTDGYTDVREFTGFYGQTRAALDPSLGPGAALTQDRVRADQSADAYRARQRELQARTAYERALKASEEGKDIPAVADVVPQPAAPAQTLPQRPADLGPSALPLPKPDDLTRSRVGVSAADNLRDRLSYLDAVNAAIRSAELDDTHDFGGSALYELSSSITLVPGTNASRFAQIDLELLPRGLTERQSAATTRVARWSNAEMRDRELQELFELWWSSLPSEIASKTGELHAQLVADRLSTPNRALLREFLESGLHSLISQYELQDQLEQLNACSPTRSTSSDQTRWSSNTSTGAKDLNSYPQRWLKERCGRYLVRALGTQPTLQPTPQPTSSILATLLQLRADLGLAGGVDQLVAPVPGDGSIPSGAHGLDSPLKGAFAALPDARKLALLRAAGIAVWQNYDRYLSEIVVVDPPRVSSSNGSYAISDLVVVPVPDLVRRTNDQRLVVRPAELGPACVDATGDSDLDAPKSLGPDVLSPETGRCKFVERILRHERLLRVVSVSPQETAQNISAVAARERVTDLSLSLLATIPQSGVTAETSERFARRSQAYAQALARQPLLVGFSEGDRRFGWVVGPKFKIDDEEASFEHAPVRYDVSAAIIVPSWLWRANLTGSFRWVNSDGSLSRPICLWGPATGDDQANGLVCSAKQFSLRPSDHLLQSISEALIPHTIRGGGTTFAARPKPSVSFPVPTQPVRLRSGVGGQRLVVLGENLWRNPEVFVGGTPGVVTVLPDMNGLAVEFSNIPYQGAAGQGAPTQRQDLLVVTSFGRSLVPGVVELFPPEVRQGSVGAPAQGATGARLIHHYTDDAERKSLRFAYRKPDNYFALRLQLREQALSTPFADQNTTEQWSADEAAVEFALPAPTAPTSLQLADVRQVSRPGDLSTAPSVLEAGPAVFVRFRTLAERSATLQGTALKLDGAGAPDVALRISFATDARYLQIAYPGLLPALAAGTATLQVGDGGPALKLLRIGDSLAAEVGKQELAANAAALTKAAAAGLPLRVRVLWPGANEDFVPVAQVLTITREGADAPVKVKAGSESSIALTPQNTAKNAIRLVIPPAAALLASEAPMRLVLGRQGEALVVTLRVAHSTISGEGVVGIAEIERRAGELRQLERATAGIEARLSARLLVGESAFLIVDGIEMKNDPIPRPTVALPPNSNVVKIGDLQSTAPLAFLAPAVDELRFSSHIGEVRLQQCVLHLLDNAQNFIGPELRLNYRVAAEAQSVVLSVSPADLIAAKTDLVDVSPLISSSSITCGPGTFITITGASKLSFSK